MAMKFLIIVFFVFGSSPSIGQIVLVFHLNSKPDLNGKVTRLEEEWKMGSHKIVYRKAFNDNNLIVADERFDGKGNRVARYSYQYDSISLLRIEEVREFFETSGKVNIQIQKYEYDGGQLAGIVICNGENELLCKIKVRNNPAGHPIVLEEYNPNGILMQTESVDYDYEKNRAHYQICDGLGKATYTGFFIISSDLESLNPQPGFKYDQKGYLIKTPDEDIGIDYDKYGNWISIKTYKQKNGVPILTDEQKRTIEYKR
jgi:hypothetical protein